MTASVENLTKKTPNKSAGHRLQFEFSPDVYGRLTAMKESSGASSYAELVRDALRVYEWFVEQERAGYEIGLIKDGQPVKLVQLLR